MTQATKFLFEVDFAAGGNAAAAAEQALKLAEAERRGFADGFNAAEKERTAEVERRTATAFEQIADALGRLVGGFAAVESRLEAEAGEVAATVGRKLAPELVAREPFAEIAALAADCLKQLAAAPHVVVRVNDALHKIARERLEAAAGTSGFAGRLVVLGEPDIALGDCRVEWADGGVVRDGARIDAAIAETVRRYVAARHPIIAKAHGPLLPELGEILR